MDVRVIQVPYDLGRERLGMGLGPEGLLDSGLVTAIAACGHNVDQVEVARAQPFTNEIGASFDVNRVLARTVRAARGAGRFPLVLAGNCNSVLGTVAGLGPQDLGLIWFDAHGEFNTPETTRSGSLDGMPLAIATGRCWKALAGSIPGFAPIPDVNVLLVGARDLDPAERELLDTSGVGFVAPDGRSGIGAAALTAPLAALAKRVRRVYVHLDLDAIDASEARANAYASTGGIRLGELTSMLGTVAGCVEVAAAGVASFDPACDADGRAAAAAGELTVAFINAVAARSAG
jgi:arginase